VQWDVLARGVILGPDSEPILDGSPYLYPARAKELILGVLRRLSRSLRGKQPRRDEPTLFKNIGMVFHDLWLELVARRPLPTSVTAEGDEVVLCRAVFDVRDRAALPAARDRRPTGPGDEVPPEVAAEVVSEFYERHYRGWLDEPLPALDGRTPRQAAGLKSARPKLISLLKEMENLSARERLDGQPAYDFGWMWG